MSLLQVNDLDRKIIELLKENGRMSYVKIAKALGVSEGTIRKRIHEMTRSGIIKRFSVEISFSKGAQAITLVSVSPSTPTSEVSRELKKIKFIEKIYEVTGQYDIVAYISAFNIAEVNQAIEEIRKVKGVSQTNTMIILNVW